MKTSYWIIIALVVGLILLGINYFLLMMFSVS